MSDGAPQRPGTSELMRSLGLDVDGPARWASPVPSRKPGVFVVELPGGAEQAPLDTVALRRWLERVPALRLDGQVATPQQLAERLAGFWLPMEPILYVGRSTRQIGGRLAAMYATELGDARPSSAGHWLRTLAVPRDLRVWWAETDAHEEYEDALLAAVAERNDGRLPFANLAAADGSARQAGLTDSLRADTAPGPAAASGRGSKPAARRPAARRPSTRPSRSAERAAVPPPNAAAPTFVSGDGLERLTAELEDLRTNVRPGVIARVKAARELGDLRENADYEYARKEQSFVEGRIQTLEAMIKSAVVIDGSAPAAEVRLGSSVTVEAAGETQTYTVVGSAEADPSAGRISNVSPVGRALLGARAGDEVTVELPAGRIAYRVIEVG